MIRSPLLLAAAAIPFALMLAGQPAEAKSKGSACPQTRWSLDARDAGPKTIIDGTDNQTYVVSAGRVSPGSTVLLEYKLNNGVKGELAMETGTSQLVEASTIALTLQNAKTATASGSFALKCK
jgi:hypothetical protein